MAYTTGGAIAVIGNSALILTIEQSLFDANAIQQPADPPPVDLTVRLNTGGFTIDLSTDLTDPIVDVTVPIWRIDDGA